jgi:hypothetical protein
MHVMGEGVSRLTKDNHRVFLALAQIPESIRGYGPVKEQAMHDALERWEALAGQLF